MAQSKDYLNYHLERLEIEELIAKSEFVEAAYAYREFLDSYECVFLRDYQVSSQLAFYTGQKALGIQYLQTAVQKGWKWKSIRKKPLDPRYHIGFCCGNYACELSAILKTNHEPNSEYFSLL